MLVPLAVEEVDTAEDLDGSAVGVAAFVAGAEGAAVDVGDAETLEDRVLVWGTLPDTVDDRKGDVEGEGEIPGELVGDVEREGRGEVDTEHVEEGEGTEDGVALEAVGLGDTEGVAE